MNVKTHKGDHIPEELFKLKKPCASSREVFDLWLKKKKKLDIIWFILLSDLSAAGTLNHDSGAY